MRRVLIYPTMVYGGNLLLAGCEKMASAFAEAIFFPPVANRDAHHLNVRLTIA